MPTPTIFDKLLPTLSQLGREKRAKREKEQRTQRTINIAQQLIRGKVSGEQRAALYAEATQLGLNLPAQYAFDLADVKGLDWAPEIKDAYNARLWTYTQASAAHSKATGGGPTDKEITEMWSQSPQLQQRFPGAGDITGPTQLSTFFKLNEYAGSVAANRVFGLGGQPQPTAKEQNLRIVNELLGPNVNIREDVLPNPNRVAQLKVAGISYDNLLEMAGYNVDIVARASRGIMEEIREATLKLEFRYDETVDKWASGETVDDASQKVLDRLMDKDTRKPKDELVQLEADRLEELAWDRAGYTPAEVQEIPKHIQPILLQLKSLGITTKEQAEEWKEQALREALQPNTTWDLKTDWLSPFNEVLEYLD